MKRSKPKHSKETPICDVKKIVDTLPEILEPKKPDWLDRVTFWLKRSKYPEKPKSQ